MGLRNFCRHFSKAYAFQHLDDRIPWDESLSTDAFECAVYWLTIARCFPQSGDVSLVVAVRSSMSCVSTWVRHTYSSYSSASSYGSDHIDSKRSWISCVFQRLLYSYSSLQSGRPRATTNPPTHSWSRPRARQRRHLLSPQVASLRSTGLKTSARSSAADEHPCRSHRSLPRQTRSRRPPRS